MAVVRGHPPPAGAAWADWLFMIGLLAIGTALGLGIGMRIAAASGALLLVFMWMASTTRTSEGPSPASTLPRAPPARALIACRSATRGVPPGDGAQKWPARRRRP